MDMRGMFEKSEFDGNIDGWKVKKEAKKRGMFWNCPLGNHVPRWYNYRSAGWFEKKYKESGVLDSIVSYAVRSIRETEAAKKKVAERKSNIKVDMVEPYIKSSIENYCKKYDIDTDYAQIRSAAESLTKYLAVKYGLLAKLSNRTVLEPIVDHIVGKEIAANMVVPYIKDFVRKYCQENNVKADDNQIQWVAKELVKQVNNEISRKQKEMAAQAKMKEMLTSDAGEGDNQKSEK